MPVEVLGFEQLRPTPGDQFAVVENEARAREITVYRQRKWSRGDLRGDAVHGSLEQMMTQLQEGSIKECRW